MERKEEHRKINTAGVRFILMTLALILVTAFCIKETVMSKENSERVKMDRYFAAMEEDFLERAKEQLTDSGYDNCGVTVTRVTDADGTREYTVRLHHRKLEKTEREEWRMLVDNIEQMFYIKDAKNICSAQNTKICVIKE